MVQVVIDSNIGERVELADKGEAVIVQVSRDKRGRSMGERGWVALVGISQPTIGWDRSESRELRIGKRGGSGQVPWEGRVGWYLGPGVSIFARFVF